MRPRREVPLTTFADPSTFPSVFESPAADTPAAAELPEAAAEETPAAAPAIPSFAELGVSAELVRVLTRDGITTPFEIQAATIPDALAGRDVLGRGQTGSGKTLAFGLPLLARTAGTPAAPKRPKALILVPTRELAM